MKIGIGCYPTFGGSGIVATELAMALAEGGDEIPFISYALPSRLALSTRASASTRCDQPLPALQFPPWSLALASKMVEVARYQGLDLLHVHYAVPNAVSAMLAAMISPPSRCTWSRRCTART